MPIVEIASLIGQINFFNANVLNVEGNHAIVETQGLGRLKISSENKFVRKDTQIIVAVRPEKLLMSSKPGEDSHTVRGELTNSAYLGNRNHFFVSIDGSEEPVEVASQASELALGEQLERGSVVWLSWKTESLVLLPAS